MKRSYTVILLILVIILGGYLIFDTYKKKQCLNEHSGSWQNYRLFECAIYHKAPDQAIAPDDKTSLEGWTLVKGAHVPTFTEHEDGVHGSDRDTVFYGDGEVVGADPATYELFDGDWYRDTVRVYYQGVVAKQSRADSFRLFDDKKLFGTDGQREYYAGARIEEGDENEAGTMLISPFNGEEVSVGEARLIFWNREGEGDPGSVAIGIINEDQEFSWITEGLIKNNGYVEWVPETASTTKDTDTFRLVFYKVAEGQVERLDVGNIFTMVQSGKPGLVLEVNNDPAPVQFIESGTVSYVSWASANVESCQITDGPTVDLVGHSFVQFFTKGDWEAENRRYSMSCVGDDGQIIEQSILLRVLVPDEVLNALDDGGE